MKWRRTITAGMILALLLPSMTWADGSGMANAAQRQQRTQCAPAQTQPASTTTTTPAPASDNAKRLAEAMANAGFSKASTAGLLGNIQQESEFNPTIASRDGGWGLAQWTAASRQVADGKQKMMDMARKAGVANPNPDSLDDQISALVDYIAVTPALFINGKKLVNEAVSMGLKLKNNDLYTSWLEADSPEDAALAWAAGYERPAKLDENRTVYARQYYDGLLADMTFTGVKVPSSARDDETSADPCEQTADTGAVVAAYISWAQATAADEKHGYDQAKRTGPDYDCSSFVASALNAAGIDVPMFSTHTMIQELLGQGFLEVTSQVDLTTGEGLQQGDILWNQEHTEFSLGGDKTVGAHWNEHQDITGGEPGDQTGEEISETTLGWSSQKFTKAFRYVGQTDSNNADLSGYVSDGKVLGPCEPGSALCYGHETGDTVGCAFYPPRNCTLWACLRRHQLKLPVGSHMGNGYQWAETGRNLGYTVNRTPHEGAVIVFARGQRVGSWNADPMYGHVAIVEQVLPGNKVKISEGGTGFATFPAYEVVSNASSYEYVHY